GGDVGRLRRAAARRLEALPPGCERPEHEPGRQEDAAEDVDPDRLSDSRLDARVRLAGERLDGAQHDAQARATPLDAYGLERAQLDVRQIERRVVERPERVAIQLDLHASRG